MTKLKSLLDLTYHLAPALSAPFKYTQHENIALVGRTKSNLNTWLTLRKIKGTYSMSIRFSKAIPREAFNNTVAPIIGFSCKATFASMVVS